MWKMVARRQVELPSTAATLTVGLCKLSLSPITTTSDARTAPGSEELCGSRFVGLEAIAGPKASTTGSSIVQFPSPISLFGCFRVFSSLKLFTPSLHLLRPVLMFLGLSMQTAIIVDSKQGCHSVHRVPAYLTPNISCLQAIFPLRQRKWGTLGCRP